jgi:hypothetical protein
MGNKVPIVVVLGIDVQHKPHASRFDVRDIAFVLRAAKMMNFEIIRVLPKQKELHAIAAKLPMGKIFASGRAFVPFVGRAAFDKLATLIERDIISDAGEEHQTGMVHPPAGLFSTEAVETANTLWSKIDIGTVVLAAQPELYGPTWWQGVVVAVDGDQLTLRWVDYPEDEAICASRTEVCLPHPGAKDPFS